MGIPILTSEGFVGQRWIIDDYFQAGETLHAGDCVCVIVDIADPRVKKLHLGRPESKVIGIVHTPAGKQVGDEVAQAGNYVSIVTKGIAKALSGGQINIGDPVIPSEDTGTGPGGNSVARVAQSTASQTGPGDSHVHGSGGVSSSGSHSHSGSGNTGLESSHSHGGSGDHEHELGSAGSPSSGHTPSGTRSLSLRRSGNPGYGFELFWVGANMTEVAQGLKTGGQMASHSHGSAGSHNHTSGSVGSVGNHSHSGAGSTGDESSHKHTIDIDRAIVVGKCLTPATGANQVIDILVDIAG